MALSLESESPAWFAWLADVPSFAFHATHRSGAARGGADMAGRSSSAAASTSAN